MGNACYYSIEKLLSSSLLSKNLKVRIYKTVILPVVLYGCETWTLTLREEHRLRVFENKVLRKIFGAKKDEVTGEWRKLHNTELHALYSSPEIIRNIKSRRLRWAGHVARMGESRNAYSEVYTLENQIHRIEMNLMEAEYVRKKYRIIRASLLEDSVEFESSLVKIEEAIKKQEVEINRLRNIYGEALDLRDVTKGMLVRQEVNAINTAKAREKELQNLRSVQMGEVQLSKEKVAALLKQSSLRVSSLQFGDRRCYMLLDHIA
ncbi:hypothetical protein ANN_26229 [Periplaneta americana]|uniref:Uncharacterized protein n=1 Tax=Periplaneta americana TaxID=6978 RepID=A0ABQ8S5T4_PERAM|nr:hypothetical protein ANN_26229 [Periplaneta americana]